MSRSRGIKPIPGVTRASHFGCGALVGFYAASLGFGRWMSRDLPENLIAGIIGALIVGTAAGLFGYKFWRRSDIVYWWWFWPAVIVIAAFLTIQTCDSLPVS